MQACIPKALYVLISCLDPITGRDANPLIDHSIRTEQNFLLEDVHAILEGFGIDSSYPMHVPLENFPIIALWEAIENMFKGHIERLLRGH